MAIMGRRATPFRRALFYLFVMNEFDHHTDDVIEQMIREATASQLDVPLGNHRTRLRVWRSEYNRGLLIEKKPPMMSFRYNKARVPCTAQGTALTEDQIMERLINFKFKDPRMEDVSAFKEARRTNFDWKRYLHRDNQNRT